MSEKPRSTAQMACTSLKPNISQMISVLMLILGGRWGRQRFGGGAMCKRLELWVIGRERLSAVLVEKKRVKKEGGNSPILASVGSMANIFP